MALQVEAYDHVDTSGGFEEYRLRENGLQSPLQRHEILDPSQR